MHCTIVLLLVSSALRLSLSAWFMTCLRASQYGATSSILAEGSCKPAYMGKKFTYYIGQLATLHQGAQLAATRHLTIPDVKKSLEAKLSSMVALKAAARFP